MNHENRFEFFNLVDRLFILENVWINKELVKVYLFVCKHAWVVFDNVLPTKQQTLMFCLSGGRHYHHHQRPTDSCRKMFLVMLSERMCTPSTHTIAFPKRQFPPKRGRESLQRKQNYFLPIFLSFGEGK